jgi:hypothetical protein
MSLPTRVDENKMNIEGRGIVCSTGKDAHSQNILQLQCQIGVVYSSKAVISTKPEPSTGEDVHTNNILQLTW